jgi:hypothetical protein
LRSVAITINLSLTSFRLLQRFLPLAETSCQQANHNLLDDYTMPDKIPASESGAGAVHRLGIDPPETGDGSADVQEPQLRGGGGDDFCLRRPGFTE